MTAHEAGVSTHQVEAAREEYEKLMSGGSGLGLPSLPGLPKLQEVYSEAEDIVNEEVKRVQDKVENKDIPGLLLDVATMKNRILGEAGSSVWNWLIGNKHATGGEVTKSGIAWVDEGEPIVPAEVARDSNLIDLLRGASEGGGGAGGNFTIQNLNVSVPAGSSDPYTFARQFRDALVNELDNPAVKAKIEQVYHRANRGYIG